MTRRIVMKSQRKTFLAEDADPKALREEGVWPVLRTAKVTVSRGQGSHRSDKVMGAATQTEGGKSE
jgi:hypothetical protein